MENRDLKSQCLSVKQELEECLMKSETSKIMELTCFTAKARRNFVNKKYEKCLGNLNDALNIVKDQSSSNQELIFQPMLVDKTKMYNSIVGLDIAKEIVRSVFILPAKYPHLVKHPGIGCVGVLLFGNPGNGKSAFAQATANEVGAPFYNIKPSQLKSKWHGESEKRVENLFTELRKNKVAVLFLDEIDSLMGERNDADNMSSFKNEFLVEMSGVRPPGEKSYILVLAATNLPNSIDAAFLSRFKYRVYVPDLTIQERQKLIQSGCKRLDIKLKKKTANAISECTEGYSGRDIMGVVDSLNVLPMSKLLNAKFYRKVRHGKKRMYKICDETSKGSFRATLEDLGGHEVVAPTVSQEEVIEAFRSYRTAPPSVINEAVEKFNEDFGYKHNFSNGRAKVEDDFSLDCLCACLSWCCLCKW